MKNEEVAVELGKIQTSLEALIKAVNGNGQPGIVQRLSKLEQQHQIVYDRQKNCTANLKENKIDWRFAIMSIISITLGLLAYYK